MNSPHSAPFLPSDAAQVESKAKRGLDAASALHRHERIALIVEFVGGLRRAARIARVNPDTINNWRKPGATLPIDGMLALAVAAGVSLDWIATGQAGAETEAPPAGGIDPQRLIKLIDLRVAAALERKGAA